MKPNTRNAFVSIGTGATYVAAHVMLRRVLRGLLAYTSPVLVRSPLGRPELAAAEGFPISFNLTHSRDFAACGILEGDSLGIDAEDLRRPVEVAEMASRWFAASERRLLGRLPEPRRREMFLRIWTLKEAILKSTGHGLRIDPSSFAVDPERKCASIPENLGIPLSWRLAECAPLPDIRLALAVPGEGPMHPVVSRLDL